MNKNYKDTVYELVELCEDVIEEYRWAAGRYALDKYAFDERLDELKQRLAESEGE